MILPLRPDQLHHVSNCGKFEEVFTNQAIFISYAVLFPTYPWQKNSLQKFILFCFILMVSKLTNQSVNFNKRNRPFTNK